jgi:MoaA/NifB/PqqE/SkfB family radical SAM enzyme
MTRPDLAYYGKMLHRELGPIAGQVELTSSCYQECAHCMSWRDHHSGVEKGVWTYIQMVKLHEELSAAETFEHLSLTGGDPQAWAPLCDYLEYHKTSGEPYGLQCNTTLMRKLRPAEHGMWDSAFEDIRLSLDAITPATYLATRGVEADPIEILERCRAFQQARVAINVCVQPSNIDEIPQLIETVARDFKFIRKIMLLIVIGPDSLSQEFFDKWACLVQDEIHTHRDVQVSCAEDPRDVRKALASGAYDKLKCRVGGSTFHIKANGDIYPCCLTGGEAIETVRAFRLGNFHTDGLIDPLSFYNRGCHYGPGSVCTKICQWKQFNMNKIAEEASKISLSMP